MSGSVNVTQPIATFDLPATDSNVNVTVTAMNAFGSGPASDVSMDNISKLHMYVRMNVLVHTYVCALCNLNYIFTYVHMYYNLLVWLHLYCMFPYPCRGQGYTLSHTF